LNLLVTGRFNQEVARFAERRSRTPENREGASAMRMNRGEGEGAAVTMGFQPAGHVLQRGAGTPRRSGGDDELAFGREGKRVLQRGKGFAERESGFAEREKGLDKTFNYHGPILKKK
jgi:hypothetical protein